MNEVTTNMTKNTLIPATQELSQGLRKRFPHLSDEDVYTLSKAIIQEVSRRLNDGEDVAFIKRNSDGTIDLTVLGLELLDRTEKK